jgi:hypothetical protein
MIALAADEKKAGRIVERDVRDIGLLRVGKALIRRKFSAELARASVHRICADAF